MFALECTCDILINFAQLSLVSITFVIFQRPASSSNTAMAMRMQGTSGVHPYGPNVPRAGLVPGAAAALEQARRRQDAKNRRRFVVSLNLSNSICKNCLVFQLP